jgi:hypothetical protein
MDAKLQLSLKTFLESQHQNALILIDCSERLFALEFALTVLDSRAPALLQEGKDKMRDESQKLRDQADSTLKVLLALVSGFSDPAN